VADIIRCTSVHDALAQINVTFGIDGTPYPDEDHYTGWDYGKGQFHSGAIFGVEGQVLYSLVRALEADTIFEIGPATGCSSTHILAALKTIDSKRLYSGLTSADLREDAGSEIPYELRGHFRLTVESGVTMLDEWEQECIGHRQPYPIIDMVFDDSSHLRPDVAAHAEYIKRLLRPGGVYVVHDVAHPMHRDNVQGGLADAGLLDAMLLLLIEPADTGIGVWRKPLGEYDA